MSDIYRNHKKYNRDRTFTKALSNNLITKRDYDLINEYITERKITKELSDARVNKLITHLVLWRNHIKTEYQEASVNDIYSGVDALKSAKNIKGKPFKQNSIHDYIRALKPFLLWLIENGYNKNLTEKKVRLIKAPSVDSNTTRPDEILTLEEVKKLISSARNLRDKALISVLYESGCRIGELARLCWRDAIFDEYGVKLYINDQKTKKTRYSRLTFSTEYLSRLKETTPLSNPDDPIFIAYNTNQPLNYRGFLRAIERASGYAQIEKKVTPHLFRKSRITHMVASNYQESVIKKSMWGNLNTNMFQTYVQLSEHDIDSEFLDQAGIKLKADQPNPMLPITCGKCHYINPFDSLFCSKCGNPLTEEAEIQQDFAVSNILADIEDDPDFKEIHENYLKFISEARAKLKK